MTALDELMTSALEVIDDYVINSESILEIALMGQKVDQIIDNLQVIRKTVDSRLSDMMDGKATLVLAGVGPLERTRSSAWKPAGEKVEASLLRLVSEIVRGNTRSPILAAREAAIGVRDFASLTWRVTALRSRGIRPTDYLDVHHGAWRVKIPKA